MYCPQCHRQMTDKGTHFACGCGRLVPLEGVQIPKGNNAPNVLDGLYLPNPYRWKPPDRKESR